MSKKTPRRSPKRKHRKNKTGVRVAAGFFLGAVVIGGVAYGVDYAMNQDNVPRGVTVGGVEIGGMNKAAAVSKLEADLNNVATKPVTIQAGELTSQLVPAEAGIGIDWEETVASAGEQSLNPITRIQSFFTTYEIDPATTVDEQVLSPAMERVRNELSPAPVEGGINLAGGTVNIDPQPANGQDVNAEELREKLVADWLKPEGVEVKAEVTEPTLDQSSVDEVANGQAKQVLSAPITAKGRENVDGVISLERMAEVVSFVPDGDAFRMDVNTERAQEILAEKLSETEVQKRNAQISFASGYKTVTPHADGETIDWEKTMEGFEERITAEGEERTFEAVYEDNPATFTTEQAEAATFDEVVSEFTTSGYSAASGTNIALTAQLVNGAIVAPGDTFSLNNWTGPRGTAQGFVESGIILNGRADKAVGGGISQFATTLYNAAYFAGFEDVAHTAHSYYISRYPAGREATVYEGAIDLQFKNNSQYPVRILASAGGGSVTVTMMGVKTVEVESVNGGRWNYTSPQPISVSGSSCSPSSGSQGFTTSDTRIIRDLAGNEISRDSTTTVYDPEPIVRCTG